MSFDAYCRRLSSLGITYERDFSLIGASTFHIGGRCAVAVMPQSEEQLAAAIMEAEALGVRTRVLGRGSNCLISDGALALAVILTSGVAQIRVEDSLVHCSAGASLVSLSRRAAQAGLSGLEFACGIPGSVGGAVYMNAGAHGGTIADVLLLGRALDTSSGEIVTIDADGHAFGYRRSIYMQGGLVCLGATLSLTKAPREEIEARMRENTLKRRQSQPIEAYSAGSYFKRPEGDFAGRLIEACGLKGCRVGGASVSEKHAGFIVNDGGASFEDVMRLEELIVSTVYEQTGVTLRREVEIIK